MSRGFVVVVAVACLALTACGGGTRSTNADLGAILQPTPDPTLDAVVRDLPHALAGIAPTATPTVIPKPAPPAAKLPIATPTTKPAPRH